MAEDGAGKVSSDVVAAPPSLIYSIGLLSLGILSYINSLKTPFIFDNIYGIAENVSIRRLWPPWEAMFGASNINRPLVGLSLAVNYAISGLNPLSYHVLNLIIHLVAGLLLMAVVRHTLLTVPLAKRFGARSGILAFVVAAIWVVHPIQTAAVTNVIQRGESLMGLFYLLTLYLCIRGAGSAKSRWWYAGAVAACLAGMMCKQVMVTAPIVVFIYDVLFLTGSPREALAKRWYLYAGMALTWIPLATITMAAPPTDTAGFAVTAVSPLAYLKSQFRIVCYYIRLSIWPSSLCLDYYWQVPTSIGQVLPFALVLAALAGATVWGLLKRAPISFLGIWFFVVLSVTSSFMPIADLAVDHRMYLPLAAIVALIVIGGQYLIDRLGANPKVGMSGERPVRLASVVLVTSVITLLITATIRRNVDYQFPIAMWEDVLRKSPDNPRAHGSLGMHLIEAGRLGEAVSELNEAIRLKPGYVGAEDYLGRALVLQGQPEAALPHLLFVLQKNPRHSAANLYLGRVLMMQGQLEQAIDYMRRAVEIEPTYAEAHYFLGLALSREGKPAEAQAQYAITSRLWPGLIERLSVGDGDNSAGK